MSSPFPDRAAARDILPAPESAVERLIDVLCKQWGEEWLVDEDANLRFSVEVEQLLGEMDGAHLIGSPEFTDGRFTLTMWVEDQIEDLMAADQLAYDIFGRISEEIFAVERRFDTKAIRYPFVTGSARHGHAGTLVLAGPHASDFADRHRLRIAGGARFQA